MFLRAVRREGRRALVPAVGLLALAGLLLVAVARPASSAKAYNGQDIFRFDTFGDEQLWTDTLHMNEVIQSSVSPVVALSVGLKVDAQRLPADFFTKHDVNDPATTVALIDRNAVVGIQGKVVGGRLKSVGITCALCHSTVDNSVAAGIGNRLDGWPNVNLNPGAIIALSPVLTTAQKAVYNSWGAGRFDPRFNVDGIDGPVQIPPALGLAGVGFETYTADGPVSYWNNYVAVIEMGGHGSFSDPRLGLNVVQKPDLVTPKLPALVEYELSLTPPPPPAGSFDPVSAQRGWALFNDKAKCSTCHTGSTYTDVLNGADPSVPLLHSPSEVGMDPLYAQRSATGAYRTTPLRMLWQHAPYFHDGSAATLTDVVNHYDTLMSLGLTTQEKTDLVEFLKTL